VRTCAAEHQDHMLLRNGADLPLVLQRRIRSSAATALDLSKAHCRSRVGWDLAPPSPGMGSAVSKIETPSRRRTAGSSVGASLANHCFSAS
jgi:hypothetical protein